MWRVCVWGGRSLVYGGRRRQKTVWASCSPHLLILCVLGPCLKRCPAPCSRTLVSSSLLSHLFPTQIHMVTTQVELDEAGRQLREAQEAEDEAKAKLEERK